MEFSVNLPTGGNCQNIATIKKGLTNIFPRAILYIYQTKGEENMKITIEKIVEMVKRMEGNGNFEMILQEKNGTSTIRCTNEKADISWHASPKPKRN